MQGNTELTALTHVAAAQSGGNPLVTLLPIILIGVVFYFLLFRPQRRRQQQQVQMQSRLRPGQRVMTTAGMLGTIVAVEDDALVLEIAPGVEARFVKQAIGQVLDDSADEEEIEEEEEEAEVAEEGPEAAETHEDRGHGETLRDEVEAKTDTQPGVAGKPVDDSLTDGENKPGKRPSA